MRSIVMTGVCLAALCPGAAFAEDTTGVAEQPAARSAPTSAQAAASQADTKTVEDIVVTARKREESLQTVPATVNAISSDTLQKVGIRRIDDIGFKVTGLNLAKTQTNTINAVIRGVGSFRNVNGVGFYFDDIQEFSAFSQGTFDVDHIEVLKGPQGTLYGGLNVGGAIKYQLKRPQFEWGGDIEIDAGNYDVVTVAGGVTGPLSNQVAFRASAYYDRMDGMMRNVFDNSEIGSRRDYGGRLALLGDFGRLHAYFEIRGNKFRTTRQQTQTAEPTPRSRDVNFNVYAQDPVFAKFDTVAPTLKLDYEFGDYTLTSLSGYSYTDGEFLADSANTPAPAGSGLPYLPLVRIHRYEPENVFQQEVRLQSPANKPLSFIVGASYLYRTHDMHGITNVLSAPPAFTTLVTIANENEFKFVQYAGFGTATYRFGGGFEASVGLRVNRSINTFTDFIASQAIIVDGQRVVLPPDTPIRAAETNVLPRVELSYHFNPDVMVYGSYSVGVNPAGAAVATSSAAQPFGREKTSAFELGLKSEFLDRRLRFNAAFFYTDYTDRTFTSAINTGAGTVRINNNIGDSRNIGFEAELTAKPVDELTIGGGISYVNSKWKKGTQINAIDLSLPPAQRVPFTVDISGLESPTTPQWTGNASIEWKQPVSDRLSLTARADMAYMGRQYWDLLNTFHSDPYALVNAQIGFEYDHWTAFVQVRNLTNVRYNLDWLPQRDTGGATNLGFPGDRRTVRVTLLGKF